MTAVDRMQALLALTDRDKLQRIDAILTGLEPATSATPQAADQLLKRKEAAALLHCSVRTVTYLAKAGRIRAVKIGAHGERALGYSLASVQALMAEGGAA